MTGPAESRDAVEELAEEFLARVRAGERPALSEYTGAHPELAERIRSLFPAVMLAEQMEQGRRPAATPDRLGDYRIVREVGRGGMGVVYEAVQEPLGRRVALKVLAGPASAHAAAAERFAREARAAARLHHTHIVPVFDVGEHDGARFYAMQFIEGRSLDELLHDVRRRRSAAPTVVGHVPPLNQSQFTDGCRADYHRGVARVGLQVAEALDHAHRRGVVHRDVKPSNLLIDPAGDVWVTDFGLAVAEGDAELTRTGDVVGTLRYTAPERFRGDSGPAGDVYSLGVTLYEMLTLRPAFAESDRHKLLDQILRDEPTPPRRLDPRVPRDLETVVLKAMAKEPRDRYASAAACADDLRRVLADRPVLARRAAWTERAWRWCRRNPWLATLAGLAAALLAVILVGAPVAAARLYDQKQEALRQLWDAHVARATAQRLGPEAGRRFLGVQALDAAVRLGPSLRLSAEQTQRLRDEFAACLTLADLGPNAPWAGYPAGSAAVCFDAGLTHYARGDESGGITIRRVGDDGEVATFTGTGVGAWALKFSPDGRYLAAGYHRKYQTNSTEFRVWDVASGRPALEVISPTGCGEADFSPDGRHVAFGRDGNALVIQEVGGEARVVTMPALPTAIAFHPDGARLAVAVNRTVEVREIETGRVLATRGLDRDVWALAWQPGGRRLAAGNGYVISLWADGADRPDVVCRGHEQTVYGLAFNRAGDLLASKSYDNTVRLWEVGTGRQLVRTGSVYAGCTPIQFDRDDRRLAFGSDGTNLWTWDHAPGTECRTLVVRRTSANWIAHCGDFTADGRWLAVGGTDGVRVWDCATGAEAVFVPMPSCRGARFTPDGSALVTGSRDGLQRRAFLRDGPPRFGPAESLGVNGPLLACDLSADGTTAVTRQRDGPAVVVRIDRAAPAVTLTEQPLVRFFALNHAGTRAAGGNLFGANVKVWDATSGNELRELRVDGSAAARFSPDDRWLVVATEKEYAFCNTADWLRRHVVPREPESQPADVSFARDPSLVAVRSAPTRLWLLDPSTGAKRLELHAPESRMLAWHALSPDGSRLVAAGVGGVLYLWDLAALRRELAARGLDW